MNNEALRIQYLNKYIANELFYVVCRLGEMPMPVRYILVELTSYSTK